MLASEDPREVAPQGPRVAADIERGSLVLRGVVEDLALGAEPDTGRPAAGVTVWFAGSTPVLGTVARNQPRPSRLSAVTDTDGRFELTVARAAASARFAELWVEGDTELRGARSQPRGGFHAGNALDVRLRRYPYGPLEGRVVDPRGAPLAGVPVSVRDEPGTAVSAHDGRFRFERVCTTYQVELSAHELGRILAWRTEAQPLPRGGFEPVEVVLAELSALHIRGCVAGMTIAVTSASSERDPAVTFNPASAWFAAANA